MPPSKKARVTSSRIPKNTTNEQMEALLDFLELTSFQNAKVKLFFSSKDNSDQLQKYKLYMNSLMATVTDENGFSGNYGSDNYINNLPNAIEIAIMKEHGKIDLNEDPHLVLQKLATCLEYCTCDLDGPGKIYEVDFTVIGEIDNDAYKILMRENSNLNVSILKKIVEYFNPSYWLDYAHEYGIGEDVTLTSFVIMDKLIRGDKIDFEDWASDVVEGVEEEGVDENYVPINQRVINLVESGDEDYLSSSGEDDV